MSPKMLIVRFPDGTREFRYPEQMPVVGGVVSHEGETFRVVSIDMDGDHASMTVEPDLDIGDLLLSEEGSIRLEPFLSG